MFSAVLRAAAPRREPCFYHTDYSLQMQTDTWVCFLDAAAKRNNSSEMERQRERESDVELKVNAAPVKSPQCVHLK